MIKKTGKLFNKQNSAGYTLFELLIVVALSGFVGSMILTSLISSKNVFKKTADRTEALQQARRSMSMICKDIQNVARTSSPFFVGLDKKVDFNDNLHHIDSLTLKLLSRESTNYISGDSSFVTVKYFIDYDKKENSVSLLKTIESYDNTDINKTNVVCNIINGINFRYLKGKTWYEKWDSGSMPDAVEITLFINTEIAKTLPHQLQTIVSIIS